MRLERYQEALTAFHQSLAIDPQLVLIWFSKGFAANRAGRYEEALAAYDSALKLKPDIEFGWIEKARVLVNLKRFQDARCCGRRTLT